MYWVVSYPTEAFMSAGPFMRWGIPQANSTSSATLMASPIASSSTLPCSLATRSASSSRCLSSSAFIRNNTWTRFGAGVFDQAGNACRRPQRPPRLRGGALRRQRNDPAFGGVESNPYISEVFDSFHSPAKYLSFFGACVMSVSLLL